MKRARRKNKKVVFTVVVLIALVLFVGLLFLQNSKDFEIQKDQKLEDSLEDTIVEEVEDFLDEELSVEEMEETKTGSSVSSDSGSSGNLEEIETQGSSSDEASSDESEESSENEESSESEETSSWWQSLLNFFIPESKEEETESFEVRGDTESSRGSDSSDEEEVKTITIDASEETDGEEESSESWWSGSLIPETSESSSEEEEPVARGERTENGNGWCYDSDGGVNLYEKGTATLDNVTSGWDICGSTLDYVIEVYCEEDTLFSASYTCPEGYSCSTMTAGACDTFEGS